MAQLNIQLISVNLLLFCIASVTSFPGGQAWRGSDLKRKDLYGAPCLNGTSSEGSNLAVCDNYRNLVCSPRGICECALTNQFKATEYDRDTLACFPVPNPEDNFRCQSDFQCRVSSYGKYSRCNADIGSCDCHHDSAPTELVNYVCYMVKPERSGETYPSCNADRDCSGSPLGSLSRCNQASQKCECYDTVSGKNEAAYYNGLCVLKRKLGEFCETDVECRVGYHANAVCRESAAFLPGEKVCQCPKAGECDSAPGSGWRQVGSSSNSVIMMGLTTFLLGLVATKIIN